MKCTQNAQKGAKLGQKSVRKGVKLNNQMDHLHVKVDKVDKNRGFGGKLWQK